jgi:hypothetical protein
MAMKSVVILACIVAVLLVSDITEASRLWLINTGNNPANDGGKGSALGSNRGIMDSLPLSANFSLKFFLESNPSENNLATIKFNKPDTGQKLYSGPEIGYLFTSGINLNSSIPKLTLRLGGGAALQKVMNFARGTASGTEWQLGSKETVVLPVGYAGLLYRLNDECQDIGYPDVS